MIAEKTSFVKGSCGKLCEFFWQRRISSGESPARHASFCSARSRAPHSPPDRRMISTSTGASTNVPMPSKKNPPPKRYRWPSSSAISPRYISRVTAEEAHAAQATLHPCSTFPSTNPAVTPSRKKNCHQSRGQRRYQQADQPAAPQRFRHISHPFGSICLQSYQSLPGPSRCTAQLLQLCPYFLFIDNRC